MQTPLTPKTPACNQAEIWDPSIRMFHWLMVFSFATAWWSEGRNMPVHLLAGCLLGGLILFRLIWGFIGSRHALFTSFRLNRTELARHLASLLHLRAEHYPGHTPIGSIMIYLLLACLLTIVLTGMALMGMQLGLGIFAHLASGTTFETEVLIQSIHGWVLNFTLALVAIHLAGVVVESLLQRSNLIAAMLTGKKTIKEKDL